MNLVKPTRVRMVECVWVSQTKSVTSSSSLLGTLGTWIQKTLVRFKLPTDNSTLHPWRYMREAVSNVYKFMKRKAITGGPKILSWHRKKWPRWLLNQKYQSGELKINLTWLNLVHICSISQCKGQKIQKSNTWRYQWSSSLPSKWTLHRRERMSLKKIH